MLENIYYFITKTIPHKLVKIILGFSNEIRWYYDYGILQETFMDQVYAKLYLTIKPNTTVIDIGANIGDTALYFAMNPNVKKVYAFEPMPSNYNLAKVNIQKTPFKDKIVLKNVGVMQHDSTIKIDSEHIGTGASRISDIESSAGETLKLVSLNKILKGMRNVVIKSGIEGYEAEIFKGADLSNVYAIQLEYHNCRDIVIKDLESGGFDVLDLTPDPKRKVGILFAKKR